MVEEIIDRNEVRVAGKPIGDYVLDGISLFKKTNNITLSTSEAYKEKTQNIIDVFAGFGIMVSKNYKNGRVAKWTRKENTCLNERTGKRELRTFFTIGLERDPKIYMYTDEERKIKIEGVNLSENVEGKIERNDERIANKPLGTYLWDCMCLFRRYDQIVLTTPEMYKDKTINIINSLSVLGVRIDKKYIDNSTAKWDTKKINIINERSGKREEKTLFIIGLIKDPNTYMYTNEERKVDIE